MTPYYELSNEEAEAVYLALTGAVNFATLQKTKKMLQDQRLMHAVDEVNGRLRLYEGIDGDVGLLRTFNPQHDLLVDGTPRPGSKAETQRDPHTRDMFAEREMVILAEGHGEPLAQVWDDTTVPKPRPERGQLIYVPTGQSTSIAEVLGWDVEREAFRVVDAGGWDGYIVSYGKRDMQHWRMLSQLLEYEDASAKDAEPQGTPAALAAELRSYAEALRAGPEHANPELFASTLAEVLPLLVAIAPDHIAPGYIAEYITRDVAVMDDNAHALARLMVQYAESVETRDDESTAEGLDAIVAAARNGDHTIDASKLSDEQYDELMLGSSGDDGTYRVADEGLPPDELFRNGTLGSAGDLTVDDDDDDGHVRVTRGDLAPSDGTDQALADGTYEPEPTGTTGGAEIIGDDNAGDNGAPEPSAQRQRNAGRAGTKAKTTKSGKGKRGKP